MPELVVLVGPVPLVVLMALALVVCWRGGIVRRRGSRVRAPSRIRPRTRGSVIWTVWGWWSGR